MSERDEVAAVFCDADETIEHMEQTDDYPCSRCVRYADALLASPVWALAERWVCDSCMGSVARDQIADMADGEHVLCKWCDWEDDPRNWQRKMLAAEAAVARVRALADEWAEAQADGGNGRHGYHATEYGDLYAADLRAALDPPEGTSGAQEGAVRGRGGPETAPGGSGGLGAPDSTSGEPRGDEDA